MASLKPLVVAVLVVAGLVPCERALLARDRGAVLSADEGAPLPPAGAVAVSAGGYHTCAIRTDGTVVCWGEPFGGKLTPPPGLIAVQLSAGQNHTCALKPDGTVACWGYNTHGQIDVPPGLFASQVSAGSGHTCAVKTDTTVACWGALQDNEGQAVVPAGLASVAQVIAAGQHSCALKLDNTVVCWGTNFNDQLQIPGGLLATELSGRALHTCALRADSTVTCWGYYRIAAMPPGVVADQVSAGSAHTCVLQPDATVRCWGFDGELLPEPQADYGQTIVPLGLTSVVQVSSGGFHTCALKTDGTVVCWGDNRANQLDVPLDLVIVPDQQTPSVNCSAADGVWHATDVSLACTANDEGSGLLNASDTSFVLSTSVSAGVETANAQTNSRTVCDVAGNCATAGPIGGNMIDKRPPTVAISAPASLTYLLNQSALANYACSDSGSGVATCTGSAAPGVAFDTSTVGPHNFAVTATDGVGHAATANQTYTVAYNQCVLFDQGKAHKAGSTIPIKLELCDAAGANVSSAAVPVVATAVYLVSTSAPGPLADSGNANPDNQFRFSEGKYIFNLSLMGFSQGTYAMAYTAGNDPTTHTVQFQVK